MAKYENNENQNGVIRRNEIGNGGVIEMKNGETAAAKKMASKLEAAWRSEMASGSGGGVAQNGEWRGSQRKWRGKIISVKWHAASQRRESENRRENEISSSNESEMKAMVKIGQNENIGVKKINGGEMARSMAAKIMKIIIESGENNGVISKMAKISG
jgi:hypothetical protein